MKIKLAEALLRRKGLQSQVDQLKVINQSEGLLEYHPKGGYLIPKKLKPELEKHLAHLEHLIEWV